MIRMRLNLILTVKSTIMKKIIAIAIFCFFSLLIKSEKTICKTQCHLFGKIKSHSPALNSDTSDSFYLQDGGSFIKI